MATNDSLRAQTEIVQQRWDEYMQVLQKTPSDSARRHAAWREWDREARILSKFERELGAVPLPDEP